MSPGQEHDSADFKALAGSRHLYETVLREFVLDVGNVKVEPDAAVDGLRFDTVENRITGMLFYRTPDLYIHVSYTTQYAYCNAMQDMSFWEVWASLAL